MNRRLLGVAGAAALVVIGTFAILAYVRDADDRARSDVELVEVYTIGDHVAAGADEHELRSSLDVEMVPAHTVVDGVLTDPAQLDGKVAAVDLVPGEQLLLARLVDQAAYDNGRNRLTSVPTGMHEVTVSLTPERVVGGQIAPGDTVAVVSSFDPATFVAGDIDRQTGVPIPPDPALTAEVAEAQANLETPNLTHILLHKVLVTRVQLEQLPKEETDADGNPVDTGSLAPTGNLLVTFALEAPDVERLVFTAEFGRIWLSYEPPEASEDGTRIQTRDSVLVDEWPEEPESVVQPVSEEVPS